MTPRTVCILSFLAALLIAFIGNFVVPFGRRCGDYIITRDQLERNRISAAQHEARTKFNGLNPLLFELIQSIVPQIVCPEAVRLGVVGDGGKWLCRPWRHSPDCVVYSLGVGGNPSFEQDVVKFSNCSTYSFDPNEAYSSLFKSDRMKFYPWFIGNSSNTDATNSVYKTVSDALKLLNHTKLEVLKVDIEGNEYDVMPAILGYTNKVQICQILTEVHGKSVESWQKLLTAYESSGYLIFSAEANWGCGANPCVEYSHIHSSCLLQYGLGGKTVFKNFEK